MECWRLGILFSRMLSANAFHVYHSARNYVVGFYRTVLVKYLVRFLVANF
uniref:Uncharacterized protein n=1 Tax=Rhizophora mucronata TaxID=61149 RepID=A0A2P2N549_RHIMU